MSSIATVKIKIDKEGNLKILDIENGGNACCEITAPLERNIGAEVAGTRDITGSACAEVSEEIAINGEEGEE